MPLEIDKSFDETLRFAFYEQFFRNAEDEAEEEARLKALLSRVYGSAGERLGSSLVKAGKLRSGAATALIHGFILRRHETAEMASMMLCPVPVGPGSSAKIWNPGRVNSFIQRILTEGSAKNKETTLDVVMPMGLMPRRDIREAARDRRKEKPPTPLRERKTRTQSQIDAALTGSPWEGSIVASNAEIIPHGYIRLSVLTANGILPHTLKNGLSSVLAKSGVEQIYILKGWYRADLLKAAAMAVREPARSRLLEAIKNESIALLEGV